MEAVAKKPNQRLFTEIFAPKTVEEMILPPRIKNIFINSNGTVDGHYLFHGGPGMGKSKLSDILSKKHPTKFINASLNGRIETLRDEIMDFCMEAQLNDFDHGTMKLVWIDEIDGVSASFFDGLRGFMDTFKDNVRFIATCNYFQKIPEAIKSRFECIDFDFESAEEEKSMFEQYKGKMAWILGGLKMQAPDDVVTAMCKNNFPDYRGVLQTIQRLRKTGVTQLTMDVVMSAGYEFDDLYKLITDNTPIDPIAIHRLLMGDYATKAVDVLNSLDLPFIKWITENKASHAFMIPTTTRLVAMYMNMIPNMVDPALPMKACVFELMEKARGK